MSLFSSSTQRQHWMFTRSQLAQKRMNARLQYDHERAEHNQGDPADACLTTSEQDLLLYYYQRRISEFAAGFNLPISVVGIAMVYFKRFYLSRTVMDEDPRLIAISSLILATKSEEAHIRIGDMARVTDTISETLIQFEQILLEGIQFHLMVHTPFRALHGFIHEIPQLTKAEIKSMLTHAESQALQALYTDAIFLYTPSQIALVCVQRSAKELRLKAFTDWFTNTFSTHRDYAKLIEIMKDIDQMIESIISRSSLNNDSDTWAHLKHKRDRARNLLRDPNSDLAKQHKQKLEQEREERRLQKQSESLSRSDSFLQSLHVNSESAVSDENHDEFNLKINPVKRRRTGTVNHGSD